MSISEAKRDLSRLIEAASRGEAFVITKAGKPLVKVVPAMPNPERRLGFMAGQFEVPDDFNRMGQSEIETLFGLDD